jgi:hypothetical protein
MGYFSKRLPKEGIVYDTQKHVLAGIGEVSDSSEEVYIEDVIDIKYNKREGWILTLDGNQRMVIT